jgi:transcriptional regulator with XRE-family HTH domain
MDIGTTISRLRKQKGLSQIEFAKAIELTQTSLSQIESGKKRPSSNTLKNICFALGISELHLYLLSFDENDVPEEKRELYRQLEGPLKDLVHKLV